MIIERILEGEKLNQFLSQLKENNGYCPCRVEQTPDTKCMCEEFRNMHEGVCHCGLYKKVTE